MKTLYPKLYVEKTESELDREAEAAKAATSKKGKSSVKKVEVESAEGEEEEKEMPLEEKRNIDTDVRLKLMMNKLKSDPLISAHFKSLANCKVIKEASLIKSLFYMLGYERQQICLEGTQELFWKTAKHLWNDDLLAKMSAFTYIGSKEQELKEYQKIEFVERLTGALTLEGVSEYSYALSTCLKWIRLAIAARKRDIGRRLLIAKTLKEERDAKVAQEEERNTNRETELNKAQEQFQTDNKEQIEQYHDFLNAKKVAEENGETYELPEGEEEPELPSFDGEFFVKSYDEEHPSIVIPPEVVIDTDNDWTVEEAGRDAFIEAYNASHEESKLALAMPVPSSPTKLK